MLTDDMKKFLANGNTDNIKKAIGQNGKNPTKAHVANAGKTESRNVDKKKKKKSKSSAPLAKAEEFSDAMRQELEVFIKNLNRGGEIQKAFVVDDDAVENVADDDDVVSFDGNYDDVDSEAMPEVKQEVPDPEDDEAAGKGEKKKKKKDKAAKKEEVVVKTEEAAVATVAVKAEDKLERADYIFVKVPILFFYVSWWGWGYYIFLNHFTCLRRQFFKHRLGDNIR
jgi:hypothetical protein